MTNTTAIGKYAIERLLGQGSMGTVHEVLDRTTGEKLALKTLAAELATQPELRERFLREARAAGALRHPNIVAVYDMGEDVGVPFFTMEFVSGSDLSRLMADGGLSLEWKIDILRQLCEGLGFAHDHGVVHRDVKPTNVRVTPEGHVKILDFGIAHLASSSITKRGMLLGSVHYMAPEQLEGKLIDHRADVFALGALAFELLAGTKPFQGESLTAVMAKIVQAAPDYSALPRSHFSPRLEDVVRRALERDPDRRYPSANAMRQDLLAVVQAASSRLG